nr:hypothetical protein CFP56_54179 [Quercus suber]
MREEIHVSSLFSNPNLLPLLGHAIISVKENFRRERRRGGGGTFCDSVDVVQLKKLMAFQITVQIVRCKGYHLRGRFSKFFLTSCDLRKKIIHAGTCGGGSNIKNKSVQTMGGKAVLVFNASYL